MIWKVLVVLAAIACGGCASTGKTQEGEADLKSPEEFQVRLETNKGVIGIEVHRAWAPRGADRFYTLVKAGYYDGCRYTRVMPGWAQFGINGEPETAKAWRARPIVDDPVARPQVSNARGTVAFAFAVKNGRTTQVFINMRDNSSTHDAEPFIPFGRVIEGMDVADHLYAGYEETAGSGIRSGKQEPLFNGGNAYLQQHFPALDYIERARVVER